MKELKAVLGMTIFVDKKDSSDYPFGIFSFSQDDRTLTGTGRLNKHLCEGVEISLFGDWKNHTKYGWQFNFSTYQLDRPKCRDGIIALLCTARGLGPAFSRRIYDKFAENSIDSVISEPDKVSAETGINIQVIRDAAASIAGDRDRLQSDVPLLDFMKQVKLPASLMDPLKNKFGAGAIDAIKADPFNALLDFKGIGYRKCLAVCDLLKIPPSDSRRILGKSIWALKRADSVLMTVKDLGTPEQLLASDSRFDLIEAHDGTKYVGLASSVGCETSVTERIKRLDWNSGGPKWPFLAITNDPLLSTHQQDALVKSMGKGKVAILTGSAGTGKTRSIVSLVRCFNGTTALCCPTGKAAQRLTEEFTLLCPELPISCTTIHRALGAYRENGSFQFRVDGVNSFINADLVVIDEASMLNNWLAKHLFYGIKPGTLVAIVGDPYQLPPIGHGTLLRDLAPDGGQLTEVQRNCGKIVEFCSHVKLGEIPKGLSLVEVNGSEDLKDTSSNLKIKTSHRDSESFAFVGRLFEDLRSHHPDINLVTDVQVITSSKELAAGSRALNKAIRDIVNPGSLDKAFAAGDKIICEENGFYDTEKGTNVFVANGEQGIVESVNERRMTVTMLLGKDSNILVTPGCYDKFSLAYAITCHKAQGSQWPYVVVVPGSNHVSKMLTCREWLYTALTRAKKGCILVSDKSEIREMVSQSKTLDRVSLFSLSSKKR